MKIKELLESGMVADYIAYQDLLIDLLNDIIVDDDLSIDNLTKKDKRITADMYKWFEDKHTDLENEYGYDFETDSFEEGKKEENFVDDRYDLARKVMATIVGEEV